MTLSLTHSGRNANHAPRGLVLLKACHMPVPLPAPFGSINKLGRGSREARRLLRWLPVLLALEP